MNKEKIIELLKNYDKEQVENFASYCIRLLMDKKNFWIQKKTDEQMAELFRRINKQGLVFDGKHITLQSTGISYDYIAYKNKMFLAYPESKVDVQLVHDGDKFIFSKENGKVNYSHSINNPFGESKIMGAYCVIKNKRGEFITVLSAKELEKHRKVAKTDFIWSKWFNEMCLKTVIKKACKQHFDDIFQEIEKTDNENYNIENPISIELKMKQEIDAIKTIKGLKDYYEKNKGSGKEMDQYLAIRKKQLIDQPNENT